MFVTDSKAYSRSYDMKALHSGGTWIDNQHVSSVIAHYTENVRVSAYENVRTVTIYKLQGMGLVMARKAAYMGHQDAQPLTFEEFMYGIIVHQPTLVAVAHHADQRLERSDLCSRLVPPAEVTGVPDFIAACQKIRKLGVKPPVSV